MRLVIRLEYKIQSTIASMLIKVDHTFDFELLNKGNISIINCRLIVSQAHEIKAKTNIAIDVPKMRRSCCRGFSEGELFVTVTAKVLGHSTGGEPLLSGVVP